MIGDIFKIFISSAYISHIAITPAVEFHKTANFIQDVDTDYSNAVRFEKKISLDQAKAIAAKDPEIGYFVYVPETMYLRIRLSSQQTKEYLSDPHAYDPLHLISLDEYCEHGGHKVQDYVRSFQAGGALFFRNEGKQLQSLPVKSSWPHACAYGTVSLYEKKYTETT